MEATNDDAAAEFGNFDLISRRFGISRSKTYELIGQDRIRAVKCGKRCLIEIASVRRYLLSLPGPDVRHHRDAA